MSSTSQPKLCACKGIRTCLTCERLNPADPVAAESICVSHYIYCEECQAAWKSQDLQAHPHHHGDRMEFSGICLVREFVSEAEEVELAGEIDRTTWVNSQSGRKKQDYGPKVNFKKKKLRPVGFTGLPNFSQYLYERMLKMDLLKDFLPVELCNLDYHPERGAAIDPHFDDFWLWGDRLVTVNLLSDTYLTMTNDDLPGVEVAVPLPCRSLVVVYGAARTIWKHAVKREDIKGRRLAITFRELTPEYLEGGEKEEAGKALLDVALTFRGTAVGSS